MKVFYINGYFVLPDDFQGNLVNALDEVSKYLETHELNTKTNKECFTQEENDLSRKMCEMLYPKFVEAITKRNRKFYATHAIGKVDKDFNITDL